MPAKAMPVEKMPLDQTASIELELPGSTIKCPTTNSAEVKILRCQLLDDGELTEELVCKICLDVVGFGPKLTRCSHLFCGDCLAQWFVTQRGGQTWAQKAKSGGLVPCPVCRETLHETKDLYPVCEGGQQMSAFLWSLLMRTKIRCANHCKCRIDGKCDWTGVVGAYQSHVQSCQNLADVFVVRSHAPGLAISDLAEAGVEPLGADSSEGEPSEVFFEQTPNKTDYSTASSEGGGAAGDADAGSSSECDDAEGVESANDDDEQEEPHEHDTDNSDGGDAAVVDPALSSLLGSIGALLELKVKAKKSMTSLVVADDPAVDEGNVSDLPEQEQPEQPLQQKHQAPPQKQVKASDTAIAQQLLAQRRMHLQEQHLLIKAARLNQFAHYQHAQAAQMAYAAQWQWQCQAAYAGQWHAAYGAEACWQGQEWDSSWDQ